MDPRFHVKPISASFEPQRLIWLAMHQDYYEGSVADVQAPPEKESGELVVKHLLLGERGHYGPLEHPSISFSVSGFPHCVMQQARTHRVGISFDVQSMRYTGKRVVALAQGQLMRGCVLFSWSRKLRRPLWQKVCLQQENKRD